MCAFQKTNADLLNVNLSEEKTLNAKLTFEKIIHLGPWSSSFSILLGVTVIVKHNTYLYYPERRTQTPKNKAMIVSTIEQHNL